MALQLWSSQRLHGHQHPFYDGGSHGIALHSLMHHLHQRMQHALQAFVTLCVVRAGPEPLATGNDSHGSHWLGHPAQQQPAGVP